MAKPSKGIARQTRKQNYVAVDDQQLLFRDSNFYAEVLRAATALLGR